MNHPRFLCCDRFAKKVAFPESGGDSTLEEVKLFLKRQELGCCCCSYSCAPSVRYGYVVSKRKLDKEWKEDWCR